MVFDHDWTAMTRLSPAEPGGRVPREHATGRLGRVHVPSRPPGRRVSSCARRPWRRSGCSSRWSCLVLHVPLQVGQRRDRAFGVLARSTCFITPKRVISSSPVKGGSAAMSRVVPPFRLSCPNWDDGGRGSARRPRAAAARGGQRSGADRLRPSAAAARRARGAPGAVRRRRPPGGHGVVGPIIGRIRRGRVADQRVPVASGPAVRGPADRDRGRRLPAGGAPRSAVDVTAFADLLAAAATPVDPRPVGTAGRGAGAVAGATVPPSCTTTRWTPRSPGWPSYGPRPRAARGGPAGCGRAAEAVAALEALVVAEPLREGAVALLMRALVAAGRQSDALAAFARLRTRLADELGLTRHRAAGARAAGAAPGAARPRIRCRRRTDLVPATRARGCRSARSSAAPRSSRASSTPCGAAGWSPCAVRAGWARRDWPGTSPRRSPTATTTACWSSSSARGSRRRRAPGRRGAAASDGRDEGGSITDRIVDALAVRHQLVVLDNCEHVATRPPRWWRRSRGRTRRRPAAHQPGAAAG